jgi:hypothetical protein
MQRSRVLNETRNRQDQLSNVMFFVVLLVSKTCAGVELQISRLPGTSLLDHIRMWKQS